EAVGILHCTMGRALKPRVPAPSSPGRAKNAWKTPRRDVSARDVVRPEVFRRRDGPRSWACVEPEPGAAPRRHEPDPIANMDKLSKLHPIRPPRRRRSCPPPSACGPRRSWPTYYARAPMSPRFHRPGPVVTRSRVIDPIVNSLFTTRSRLAAPMVLSDNTVVGASFDGSRFDLIIEVISSVRRSAMIYQNDSGREVQHGQPDLLGHHVTRRLHRGPERQVRLGRAGCGGPRVHQRPGTSGRHLSLRAPDGRDDGGLGD